MDLKNILGNVIKAVKVNSPEILTALGVSGVITTSYLAGKASFKASEVIREEESKAGTAGDPKQRLKERTQLVWKLYIPTGISGAATIGCIIGAAKAGGHRTAAAVTAYSLTEKAFGEYREKVVEQVGKGKEQKIRDEIAQDTVNANPASNEVVYVGLGGGQILFCELFTKRYFRCDMETIRKYINDINFIINQQTYVTLNEFYDMIGLPYTGVSDSLGWDSNKLMDLNFTTCLSESGEPCIAFAYNYVDPIH